MDSKSTMHHPILPSYLILFCSSFQFSSAVQQKVHEILALFDCSQPCTTSVTSLHSLHPGPHHQTDVTAAEMTALHPDFLHTADLDSATITKKSCHTPQLSQISGSSQERRYHDPSCCPLQRRHSTPRQQRSQPRKEQPASPRCLDFASPLESSLDGEDEPLTLEMLACSPCPPRTRSSGSSMEAEPAHSTQAWLQDAASRDQPAASLTESTASDASCFMRRPLVVVPVSHKDKKHRSLAKRWRKLCLPSSGCSSGLKMLGVV